MLTAADVEACFVETARVQINGEPFDWDRLARLINARLADQKDQALAEAPAFRFGDRQ
jgi:hypothetical protein